MKKLISMLLFVATALFATSCDEIDDLADDLLGNTEGTIEYTGAFVVTNDGSVSYSDNSAVFTLEAEDNAVSILMNGVCFDSEMPYSMDITISGMTAIAGVFSASTVVPTIGGEAQEDRTLTNVAGVYSETSLTLTFDYGDYTVAYTGSAE
ncbi:MAG: hypothetical protein SNH94_02935 [Rikenellaceae bacterium]